MAVTNAAEYWLWLNYVNGSLQHNKLKIDDEVVGTLLFPGTGAEGTFAQNAIRIPVLLQAGEHVIMFEKRHSPAAVAIDFVEVSR